jgi:UDP-N-acetylglucosamine 2-epimerase (non-hydrolysing)
MMKTLFVLGTRPEAIKLAPLVRELCSRQNHFEVRVCVTAQHREMLDQVLRFFEVKPDYDLDLMRPGQTLFDLTAVGLRALETVLEDFAPDHVIVQGDTTTTFLGALAALYRRITVSHIEAGLRSGNKLAPFPEEMNRTLTGRLADLHFAPTERARECLAREGIRDNVWVVGNTVIDALFLGLQAVRSGSGSRYREYFSAFGIDNRRIVLITGHRRESFGRPFENIAFAIRDSAARFPDVQFVYPVHLNPNVQEPVRRILGCVSNVHLLAPLDYPQLLWLMDRSYLVLTDSGGIQEEAPSLGKPVLVMRDVTERIEGIEAGTARLVGTDKATICEALAQLLSDQHAYRHMANAVNPYGDGTTSRQIADVFSTWPALVGARPA